MGEQKRDWVSVDFAVPCDCTGLDLHPLDNSTKIAFIALLPYFFYSRQARRNWCLWLGAGFPFVLPGAYYLSDFHLGMYQGKLVGFEAWKECSIIILLLMFIDLLILLRQGTSHSLWSGTNMFFHWPVSPQFTNLISSNLSFHHQLNFSALQHWENKSTNFSGDLILGAISNSD